MGKKSRDKGQRGERQVADMLTAAFPEGLRVRRNINQAREGGEDIKPEMVPGFSIEVKWCETFLLPAWWDQAVRQALNRAEKEGCDIIPALVYKRNLIPWRVRVPLRLYVPYANWREPMDISWEAFVTVIRHEQHRLFSRQRDNPWGT